MKRGDVVLAAAAGDYGKPRPWAVVQADLFAEHPSVSLCPISTFSGRELDFRIRVDPSSRNGLRESSQIQADKIQTLARGRVRARIGALDAETLRSLDTALRVWLGLA